ncbi:hypothetical protein RB599_000727 [Gaeumannomyces hyphopodioides]
MPRPCFWLIHLLRLLPPALAWQHVSGSELATVVERNRLALVALVLPLESKSRWLEAQWDAAAASATADEALVSIDCSTAVGSDGAGEVCALASLDFPAIRVFRHGGHGSPAAYQGSVTAAAISQYLARHRRPDVSELATAEALASFQTADQVVFVAFMPPQGGAGVGAAANDPRALSYHRAALRYRDEFSFGLVTDPALAGSLEGGGDDGSGRAFVVCHRPGDSHVSRFVFPELEDGTDSTDDAAAALEVFIHDGGRPDIAYLALSNHQRYLDRGWPMVYLFACTEAERDTLRASLAPLAKSYRDSLTVVVADPFDLPGLPERLGLGPPSPSCPPSGALHQLSKDRVYPYPTGRPVDARSVQQWGLDVFQGRVRPWLPPGAGPTSLANLGPTRMASRKLSVASIPGVKIRIAGRAHDEL